MTVTWADGASATVAVLAFALSLFNLWFARSQRRDSLFSIRYDFYQRFRDRWLQTGHGAPEGHQPWRDGLDLIPFAEEARFLFGREVAKFIESLSDKQHDGDPSFPNDDFVKPFRKYLTL